MKYTYLAALLIFSLACDCQEIEITALRPTNRCPNGELNLSINDGLGPYDITWSWESGSSSFVNIGTTNSTNTGPWVFINDQFEIDITQGSRNYPLNGILSFTIFNSSSSRVQEITIE